MILKLCEGVGVSGWTELQRTCQAERMSGAEIQSG